MVRDPSKRRRVFSWITVYFIGTIVLVLMRVPGWGVLVAALGLSVLITVVEIGVLLRNARERRRSAG